MKADQHRQKLEACGIEGRALEEYRPDLEMKADDGDNEFRLAGPIISDDMRSYYGEGEASAPGDLYAWMKGRKGDITVLVNSPGGNVFAGVEMMNTLKKYDGDVNVEVMGLAASAASLILLSGDRVSVAPGAMVMVHRSSGVVLGNAKEMQAFARRLEMIDSEVAKSYAERTGKEPEEMLALMDEETWMGAGDAVEAGFADGVLGAEEEEEDDGEEEKAEPEGEDEDEDEKAEAETEEEMKLADEVAKRSFATMVARLSILSD